jgi:hypothetical protein
MVAVDPVESDMGLGLTVVLGLVTLAGAGAMVAGPSQTTKAWGFGLAVVAATLAVVAAQAYG